MQRTEILSGMKTPGRRARTRSRLAVAVPSTRAQALPGHVLRAATTDATLDEPELLIFENQKATGPLIKKAVSCFTNSPALHFTLETALAP